METKYEAWNKASPEKSAEAIAPKGLPKGGFAAMNEGGGPNLGGWGSMEVTERASNADSFIRKAIRRGCLRNRESGRRRISHRG